MVKIAVAGGSGGVGRSIVDALVATKKHDILILSRKDAPATETTPGTTWIKANYDDPEALAEILKGVHTVLSTVGEMVDGASPTQKALIDASIRAGVKRFAPSEWASASFEHLSWYMSKIWTRKYLEEINKNGKVLEYSLFQPGWFVNYLTYPYKSTKHVEGVEFPVDFNNRRALIVDDNDKGRISLTTVEDLANVVAQAVEYDGEWPVNGGMRGTQLTIGELVELGGRVRGAPFTVEKLNVSDLLAGDIKGSWLPNAVSSAVPPEYAEGAKKMVTAGILLGMSDGALQTTDTWNKLLPEYKFTQAEDFLAKEWSDKP